MGRAAILIGILGTILPVVFLPQSAAGQTGPTTAPASPELQAEIDQAIRQLGDRDYNVRQAATDRLAEIGLPALPAVQQGLNSSDPEVADRCRIIIDRMSDPLAEKFPPEMADKLKRFLKAGGKERGAILVDLLANGRLRSDALLAMIDIPGGITAADLTEAAPRFLPGERGQMAAAMILRQREPDALALVGRAAAGGQVSALRDYAVFLFLTGKLGDKIRQLEAAGDAAGLVGGDPAKIDKALACFHLVNGDLAKARAAADKAGDDQLIQQIAILQSDWKTAAAICAKRPGRPSSDLVRLVCFQRLAGARDDAEQTIAKMKDAVGKFPAPGDRPDIARAFLAGDAQSFDALGMMDEAAELRLKAGEALTAFDILEAHGRFDEAAAVQPAESSDYVQFRRARLFYRLGEDDKADAVVRNLIEKTKTSAPGELAWLMREIGSIEMDVGLREKARGHLKQAIILSPGEGIYNAADRLFPGRKSRAQVFWRLLYAQHRDETGERLLARLEALLAEKMNKERFAALAREAEQTIRASDLSVPAEIGRACLEAGYPDLAGDYFDTAGATAALRKAVGSFAWTEAADEFARQESWAQAAKCYARDAAFNELNAGPLYLHGWALALAGDKAKGERLMRTAELMPLGCGGTRDDLAFAVVSRVPASQADRQQELALRTACLGEWRFSETLEEEARRAISARKFTRAADLVELQAMCGSNAYLGRTHLLDLHARAWWARAMGFAADRKFDKAREAVAKAWDISPNYLDRAIQLIGDLDKAGEGQAAEQIFHDSFKFLRDLAKRYPHSAEFARNVAWLAARSRRGMGESLEFAETAARRRPDDPSCLMALAELHFQRGQRDKAIELANRCLQLEPDNPVHRSQLERYQNGRAQDR